MTIWIRASQHCGNDLYKSFTMWTDIQDNWLSSSYSGTSQICAFSKKTLISDAINFNFKRSFASDGKVYFNDTQQNMSGGGTGDTETIVNAIAVIEETRKALDTEHQLNLQIAMLESPTAIWTPDVKVGVIEETNKEVEMYNSLLTQLPTSKEVSEAEIFITTLPQISQEKTEITEITEIPEIAEKTENIFKSVQKSAMIPILLGIGVLVLIYTVLFRRK